ncbi:MAG: hypothetical protein VW982_00815 [Candidatus Poseidoniales archaeon]
MGALRINGRRGRKEEFNPFAKDASQQHRRRREDRDRQQARRPAAPAEAPVNQPRDIKADFQRKQREAIEKLEQKGDVSAPAVVPAPVPVEQPKEQQEKPIVQTHEDRLAELRRKSEETKKSASRIEATPELNQTEATVLAASDENADLEPDLESLVADDVSRTPKSAKNVFATIETKVEKKQDRRRGRRRFDKKGGGKQKPEKKLNRQKYLEYKYAAKDILDNPNVPEEHRSNVLGQIWAKGERQGIDDCLAFIEQKEAELILPESVAGELRELVKRMTTKR